MADTVQSQRSEIPPDGPIGRRTIRRVSGRTWVAIAVLVALVGLLASFQEIDIYDDRIENPSPDPTQEPNNFLGIGDGTWCNVIIVMATIVGIGMFTIFYRFWQRTGRVHPGVALYAALTTIALFDPIFNWAMYACYNPKMLHVPVDWPYFNISPTVEPLWVVPGYAFFYLTPALMAVALCRWWNRRRAQQGIVAPRHEMWMLFGVGTVIGMAFDAVVESLMINMGIWQYWRYWGPALETGNSHLPITEIILLGVTAGICAAMMHLDDRGRSVATRLGERWAARRRPEGLMARRKGFAEIAVAVLLIDAFFAAYIGFYAVLRVSDHENTISGHWHFPSIKVYDPDDHAKNEGIPGPYYDGYWSVPNP